MMLMVLRKPQRAISAAASDATSKANQALADAKADAEAKYAAKATTLAGYGITRCLYKKQKQIKLSLIKLQT